MGHKKYKLVGDVEVPYEGLSMKDSLKLFSIDFYPLSDKTCCQKQITGYIVKITIFNMAAMKKCRKLNMGISVNFNHHR